MHILLSFKNKLQMGLNITAAIVSNNSDIDGDERVQMQVSDKLDAVAPSVIALISSQKTRFKAAQTLKIAYKNIQNNPAFYEVDKTQGAETGDFRLSVVHFSENADSQRSTFDLQQIKRCY